MSNLSRCALRDELDSPADYQRLMLTRKQFEKLVREGVASVPARFRVRIKNVAIIIEDEPSEEVRREEGLALNETLLGLYRGIPATERGDSYGMGMTLPDTITLYQRPIEEAAGGVPARISEEVRDTVWHEIAHYFGMDEGEVRARENKGSPRQADGVL